MANAALAGRVTLKQFHITNTREARTMKFNISFTLERDDELMKDDESHFDREHIASEIKTWLEDLDYTLPNGIKIQLEK